MTLVDILLKKQTFLSSFPLPIVRVTISEIKYADAHIHTYLTKQSRLKPNSKY